MELLEHGWRNICEGYVIFEVFPGLQTFLIASTTSAIIKPRALVSNWIRKWNIAKVYWHDHRKLQCRVKKSHNVVERERCIETYGDLLEMEGKLQILSESKLTTIISFTCESNI